MVLRPRSQRPMPASADRARRCHLQACIAVRCAAPMASVLISAITPLLVQLSTARPLPEPVTMAQATVATATVTRLTAMTMAPVTATRLTAMAPVTALRGLLAIGVMAMAGALSAAVSMAPLGIVGAKAD